MNEVDFAFLQKFPDGLNDELWIDMGKKHKTIKITEKLNDQLSKQNFKMLITKKDYQTICDLSLKLLRQSTMISVFEKVAFANYLAHDDIKKDFSLSLFDFMYKFGEDSFKNFVLTLARHKKEKNCNACKWTVVTFFKAYQDTNNYIFVKPTSIKAISNALHTEIGYTPYPNYETYMKAYNMVKEYRDNSDICKNADMMTTEAVLYVTTKL